ncbi:unnamed protein product, partial [Prorocentrum cordatum]
ANGRSTYTFCRACDQRIAFRKKTEQEKMQAAAKELAKAKGSELRKNMKQMVSQQLQEWEDEFANSEGADPR